MTAIDYLNVLNNDLNTFNATNTNYSSLNNTYQGLNSNNISSIFNSGNLIAPNSQMLPAESQYNNTNGSLLNIFTMLLTTLLGQQNQFAGNIGGYTGGNYIANTDNLTNNNNINNLIMLTDNDLSQKNINNLGQIGNVYVVKKEDLAQVFGNGGFTGLTGKTPVNIDQTEVEVIAKSWGDPHFNVGDKHVFDFQGKDSGLYQMLENSDVALTGKFKNSGPEGARVVSSQNLEFKGTGINIVSHMGGKFEIFRNGQKIGDQDNYSKEPQILDALKKSGIELNYDSKKMTLSTKFNGRTIEQELSKDCINNNNATISKTDRGLLTQAVGASDKDFDGKTVGLIDVNKDGNVDDKDVLNYDEREQFMIDGKGVAAQITKDIEAAIQRDIQIGIEKGSVAKGFREGVGYSAMQWNEFVGEKLYSIKENKYLAA